MVNANFPKYYFKFLSFGEYSADTLEKLLENKVYTPLIDQLNDPFEGVWYGNQLYAEYPSGDKEIRDRLNRRRIYCLCSNDSEEFPYSSESITMWSHYADSHKGFCIMFSNDILEVANKEDGLIRKIEYSDSLPEVTGNRDRDMTLLFRKSNVWKSEREVRLCFRDKDKKGKSQLYREIPKGCIMAIFAGSRISTLNDCLLHGLSQKLKCDYIRLKLSNQSFTFERKTNAKSNKKLI